MRKKLTGKAIALLLALVMIVSLLPSAAFAVETEELTVVVSMEGLTLGQGLYVEPKAYTLDEINTLIATKGYGPYTESTLTASMATLAMMIDHNLEYENNGSWDNMMYLSSVKGVDKGVLDIPAVITENGGPSNEENDGNDDEYLGEFDYSSMSGWMITVNDFVTDVGCADWVFADGVANGKCEDYGKLYVVRWHFTLYGYGADLGFNSFGGDAYFEHVNKDMMYAAYAFSDDSEAKASVMSTMENLTATAAEVAAAEAALAPKSEPDQPEPDQSLDVSTVLNDTMAQLAESIPEPTFGSTGGEWSVLCLARGGYYGKDNAYFTGYYDRIVDYVNETAASVTLANGALHKNKSTDNSRLILALSSIGKEATSVGDWNLITPFENFSWIKKQGINGPIFALIALDTHDYQTTDTTIRQQCVDYILESALEGGGWALSGEEADPDITAMALQALVNYKDQAAVSAAAEEAFAWLSSAQNEDGSYTSWDTVNCESIAQVITACATWGINPDTDSRFVKNGKSAVDAILTYYDSSAKAFKHVTDGGADAMATDQACYALVAYDRLLKGKNALYNMSDVTFEAATDSQNVSAVLNSTMAKLAQTVAAPTYNNEWTILGLARGGYYETGSEYFNTYYSNLVAKLPEVVANNPADQLPEGALTYDSSTNNSRVIIALSSIGKYANSVGDYNLLAPYENFSWVKSNGVNGPVFALIALDTADYQTTDTTIRKQCIDYILEKQLDDGGWNSWGSNSDVDMTAMTLQALAPYRNQEAVTAAANEAFAVLSNLQDADGAYASWGTVNAESIAQVITACAAWGINPDTDNRFVKNGNSAVDALLTFYNESEARFYHTLDAATNDMATNQACYALVAYDRLLQNKTSLYDMSDVTFEGGNPATDEMTAILGLPAEVEYGTTFNAIVSLSSWDNEAGYKLIDLIVNVPEGLSVTSVTAGARLSGGELSYNLEADTGKLRIVYFDSNTNSDLTISGTEYPAEVLTIGFALDNAAAAGELPIAISGMSVKRTSDPTAEDAMVIVNTANASGNVEVVQGISFSAVTVYTGDDVDLIPSNKKAVAVSVTGATVGEKLQYNDGTHEITFLYSLAISRKIGANTYLALVDADIAMSEFVNKSNYSFPGGKADRIEFGDINGDAEVNAQDALAVVDFWLRKGEEPTDLQILTSNVNGDSRINTFDALGIVEAFVNGDISYGYLIVTKISTLFTNS